MKKKSSPSETIIKYLKKYLGNIYLFLMVGIKRFKVNKYLTLVYLAYLELMYKVHLKLRLGHDIVYKNVVIYKRYTDNPLSRIINSATVYSFVFSTIIFLSLQFGFPGLFGLGKPNQIYAAFNGVLWTKKSDFSSVSNSNILVSGANGEADSSLSLKSTQDFGGCGEECGTVNMSSGGTSTLSFANTGLSGAGAVNNVEESSGSLTKVGTWVNWADASHSGGNAIKTTGTTGEITYSISSSEYIAFYATKHTGAGVVSVELNGAQVANVDLNLAQTYGCVIGEDPKCGGYGYFDTYSYNQKIYEFYPNVSTTYTLKVKKSDTATSLPINYDYIKNTSAFYSLADGNAKTITVASSSGFAVGQRVLIAQMLHNNRADFLALPNGGQEEAKIAAINGNNIEFENPLINNYYSDTNSKAQVLQIKEYWDLTISNNTTVASPGWDGTKGGIMAIKVANNLDIQSGSKLDMTGRGYRVDEGPGAGTSAGCYGGSGGSYGGAGGSSLVAAQAAYGSASNNSYMGSGGGNAGFCGTGPSGAGGGLIKLAAKNIILAGSIQANGKGGTGKNASGGAGGGVNILAYSINNTGKISAAGGGGGSNASNVGGQDGLNGIGGSGGGMAGGAPGSPPGNGGTAQGASSVAPGPSAGGSGYDSYGAGGGAAGRISFGYTWFNGTQVGAYTLAAKQDSDPSHVKTGTWSNWADASHSGGSATRTSGNSADLIYTVTGTELFEYYGTKHSGAGIVEVLVNGVSKATVDLNIAQVQVCTQLASDGKSCIQTAMVDDYQYGQLLFSIGQLSRGNSNTITIRKSDTANTKPINLDYFNISTGINNATGYADARFSSNSVGPYGYYTFLTPYNTSGTVGALLGTDLSKLANNGAKVLPASIEASFDGDPIATGIQGLVNGQAVKILLRASNDNSNWITYSRDGAVVTNIETAFSDSSKYWGQTFDQPFTSTVQGVGIYSHFALIVRLEGTGESSLVLDDITLRYSSVEAPVPGNVYLTKIDGTTKLKNSLGQEVQNGTSPGGITNEGSFRLYSSGLTCTDCTPVPANIWTQVEVKPVGVAFNDAPADVFESALPTDNYTEIVGLTGGQSYHFRVRAVDSNSRVSAWTEISSADVNEADVKIDQIAPTVTTMKVNSDDTFATTGTRLLDISGIFDNPVAPSESLSIQFSQDGLSWGIYSGNGSVNNRDGSWLYAQTITPSAVSQTLTDIWYMEGADNTNLPVYVRTKDHAGNVSSQILETTQQTFNLGLTKTDINIPVAGSLELQGSVAQSGPPYKSSGIFESQLLGLGAESIVGKISWVSSVPDGSSISVKLRAGTDNNPADDLLDGSGNWTAWENAVNNDVYTKYNGKTYIQYQVSLGNVVNNQVTPRLYDLFIESYGGDKDLITLDTMPPNSPSGLFSYSAQAGDLLDPNTWYGHTAPYFNWADNGENDLAGYKYCFSQDQNCVPSINVVKEESYKSIDVTDNVAFPDGNYYFRVFAYDLAGNPSVVNQLLYKTDKKIPGIVTGYTATQNNETTIKVSWAPVSSAGGSTISYVLERIPYLTYYENGYTKEDQVPSKVWSNLATYKIFAATTATSITETVSEDINIPNRLIGGVKYVYRIKAYDETGKSSAYQNNPFYGLTRDGTDPLPPTAVNVNACSYQNPEYCETTNNNLKGSQTVVRWSPGSDAGTGIVGYEIYRTTGNPIAEADYQLAGSVSVANPLPVMDQFNSLVFYDNNLSDYVIYHYRVVAVDGAADQDYSANKSRIVKNVNDYGNYANVTTPDITAPSAPVATVAEGGLDDPMSADPKQKMIITWEPSTDSGSGVKTYKVYRATRYDTTNQSNILVDGDFVDITDQADLTCDFGLFECTNVGLEDVSFYYYRLKAVDGDPYNNFSVFSNTATTKTLSSAVPTPPRGRKDLNTQVYEQFPYVYSTKGNPAVNSSVGDEVKITFSGSYVKFEQPFIARYEVYRSLNKISWTRIGGDITPIRNDNDTDNQYTVTDNGLTDATKYYYRVRAVGNNPGIDGGGESYSNTGSSINQGWDVTPDTTAPMLPQELKVKDIHDDGISFKRNIVTWARISDPLRNGANDFKEYKVYRSTDGVLWSQLLDDFGKNPLYSYDPDKTAAENQQINMATNYYMDLIPNAVSNRYYYYYVTASDDAGTYVYQNTQVKINEFANESNPPRDSDNKIIAVSLNPAIAKPTIATSGGLAPKLTNTGVSSATIEWYADQDTDSVVEFKSVNDNKWVTIGDRAVKRYNEVHSVNLFGLLPKTEYQFKLISRNYLGNEDVLGDTEGERNILPRLVTDEFNITPGKVSSTTTGAEINWVTNLEASSAFVEYELVRQGSDEPQGKTVGVNPDALSGNPKNHRVVIQGLKSNRTYKYKIKSISKDGFVAEYPTIKNENRINESFATRSFDTGQFTLAPSSSNVAERNITATTAQIVWQTGMEATSWVDYATKSGVYDMSSGNDNLATQHVVVIEGLIPGTTYYYRVRAKDANDIEYTSQEYSFTAVLKPKISNMRVKDVTPYSVTISWDTNVDTETIINWGQTTAYGEKKGISGVSKVHELKIDNLIDNQEYHYQILAKDETGNEVADDDKVIRTPLDTEGPKIENVKLDVLPMGESDNTGQVIISWTTNKPATGLIEYDEGVIGGKYSQQSIEDLSLNTSHTVIVKELKPATSYHYRIVSKDKRNNASVSQDYTFVTPTREKSILQLIIKSLEETFSWTRNLNLFFSGIGKRFGGR